MCVVRGRLRRSRRRATARAAPSPALVQVAARGGGVTHLVTDVEMGATAQGRTPRGLCGRMFVPAGLTVPPGPLCPLCAAVPGHRPRRPR